MLYHPFRMSPRLAILLLVLAAPAFAQLDLTGVWLPVFHEDQPERIPGPSLVDYLGLPINDSARKWALAWDPDRLTAQEHQCQVHTAAYIFRGPLLLRIWEETRKTVLFITHSVDEAVTLGDRIMIMTAHPGRTKVMVDVPFERPRGVLELRARPAYGELVYNIWGYLKEEVQRARAQDEGREG